MKVIIAGSRHYQHDEVWDDICDVVCNLKQWSNLTEIVSGGSKGVDQIGESFAMTFNFPLKQFPADWEGLGRKAGPIRNQQMADYADVLVAIWDGQSRGTMDMVNKMKAAGKPIYLRTITKVNKEYPNEYTDSTL